MSNYYGTLKRSIFMPYLLLFASELLEHLEEIFPRYYMGSDMLSVDSNSSVTHWCVIRRDRFNRHQYHEWIPLFHDRW